MRYSIGWETIPKPKKRFYEPDVIHVKTTFLDENGQVSFVTRKYREWLGVCTRRIDKVVAALRRSFPNCPISYTLLGTTRKILPYFESRLCHPNGKLDSLPKPFYKVYIRASLADVGRILNKNKISYYDKEDWLVRLYLDLCIRHNSEGFFYKWYTVSDSEWLMDSFCMHPEHTLMPDWTIGAFDLETVPMDGADRVPTGLDETDEIVMISLYKWNQRQGLKKWLLYRTPCCMPQPLDVEDALPYSSEKTLLNNFHVMIQDCHVLTGYNINGFDIPCLFARLSWLEMNQILRYYSSAKVGQVLVTTFQKKLVVDLYHYFRTFSSYDLPGFKLDDVAKMKLNESKVPINSTGIWAWYTNPNVTPALVQQDNVQDCYNVLKPKRLPLHQFGTFTQYMAYCFKDSLLVVRLFQQERVLSFLVERANFTGWNANQALYMGNSSFLLELFKTYGTRLGFFINTKFMKSGIPLERYTSLFGSKNKTYQGALNYCIAEKAYKNVSVMDFASMYPSALVSSNLCYGTCTILSRTEWLANPRAQTMTCIPYRNHGDDDFAKDVFDPERFRYPVYDPAKDDHVIVINTNTKAFLPLIVQHFIDLRKHHQKQYKETQNVYHYNVQLCIKILINSLYGVMANKQSCLMYLPIAMTIVTLSRYQLLGSYHYLKRMGYNVCYADTDSLMVEKWPTDNCEEVNRYLDLPHVELKYEQRMLRLLVLSRKRYIYETEKHGIVTKGFQKRINELVEFISELVLQNVWSYIFEEPKPIRTFSESENVVSEAWSQPDLKPEGRGWLLWVEIVQKAQYKCRNSEKYSICRKTKHLNEYKSRTCAAVRMLEKYPEKANDYIDYTYTRADVSQREASKWVVKANECRWVNYEQIFMSQKKIFCILLNMAFWKRATVPMSECDSVINAFRWKQFMHAELLFWHRNKRRIVLMVETGTRYTFVINDHFKKSTERVAVRGRPKKKMKTS